MTALPIAFREARSTDMPFFYSAILQSFLYGSKINKRRYPDSFKDDGSKSANENVSEYYNDGNRILSAIIARPTTRLVMVYLHEDEEVLVGFICTEIYPIINTNQTVKILHYMYVKRPFRLFGIAARLMEEVGANFKDWEASHWTTDLHEIIKHKNYPGLIYNPYLLME